jgi:hypothetical protein
LNELGGFVVGSEPGAGGNDGDTRIFIFSFGGVDKYLGGGGGCCLLWPGPGGNARKSQGKSLTKFVF